MYEKRWEKVREKLRKKKANAFVSKLPSNIRYLTSSHLLSPIATYLIIPLKGEPIAVVPTLEEFRAKEEFPIDDIRVYGEHEGVIASGKKCASLMRKALNEIKAKKVVTDANERIIGIKVKKDDFIKKMRVYKDKEEVRKIKKAAEIVSNCANILHEFVGEGRSEREVANELDYALREKGSFGNPFSTIIASGPHSAYSHHDVTNRKIRRGETVICDFGAYFDGYCADITRTVSIGGAKEWEEIYNIVLEAQEKAIKVIKHGKEIGEIDRTARNVIKEYGYSRYYVHGTGHGVG
ncbi:MAG: Xaa-Pro peptidase family protein, partial [Candidatus Thermoplasmatota archaeon]